MPSKKTKTLTDSRVLTLCLSLLTSMSLELLPGNVVVAGTIGLLAGGAVGLEQCCGMLGETGSILTMAGVEPRQTDGERTTAGGRWSV